MGIKKTITVDAFIMIIRVGYDENGLHTRYLLPVKLHAACLPFTPKLSPAFFTFSPLCRNLRSTPVLSPVASLAALKKEIRCIKFSNVIKVNCTHKFFKTSWNTNN
jgi:hypothetical protein